MPTVEFSPTQLDNMIRNSGSGHGIWGNTTTSNTPNGSHFGGANTRLALFSGTIPDQPRLMTPANFSSTLIFWNPNTENTTLTTTNPLVLTTTYKQAIATGTATWFSLAFYTVTPPATNGVIYNRIIGTVGTIGSGADLEINDVNIVTGRFYRVFNFRLGLPSSYTY